MKKDVDQDLVQRSMLLRDSLETDIGRGTTFVVILPVVTEAVLQGADE